jgi:KDO2-lipid IV(A) lauroyltransferase
MRILGWRVEYALVRGIETVTLLLPRNLSLALGEAIGTVARLFGVRRSVVLANFDYLGFPAEETRRILPALYANMGRYLVDLLRAGRKPPPYRVQGDEVLSTLGERGTLVLLAHFGNFEVLATIFGSLVEDLHVIVKPMHNPYIEEWLRRRRMATGVTTLAHQKALRKGLSVLRRKGVLAALVDQNPGREGTPVSFLGKPALTVRAFAGLQLKTGASVVSAYAILGRNGVYDVVLAAEPHASEDEISAVQARHNDAIGAWVQKHPEHWFGWFHRRFRPYLDYPR